VSATARVSLVYNRRGKVDWDAVDPWSGSRCHWGRCLGCACVMGSALVSGAACVAGAGALVGGSLQLSCRLASTPEARSSQGPLSGECGSTCILTL
jgi:hypothetical protein